MTSLHLQDCWRWAWLSSDSFAQQIRIFQLEALLVEKLENNSGLVLLRVGWQGENQGNLPGDSLNLIRLEQHWGSGVSCQWQTTFLIQETRIRTETALQPVQTGSSCRDHKTSWHADPSSVWALSTPRTQRMVSHCTGPSTKMLTRPNGIQSQTLWSLEPSRWAPSWALMKPPT